MENAKLLLEKANVDYNTLKTLSEIVRSFIISRKMIVVGGTSIDYALKLKGDKGIYHNDKLPDFDVLSSNSVIDAYELTELLCKKGYKNLSCIKALHKSTMKVRYNFVELADITYCPTHIFESLETLKYKEVTSVHPHFQYLDIHRALSIPFENPHRPVILARWINDAKRYNMLYEHYPITTPSNYEKPEYKPVTFKLSTLKGYCLFGYSILDYTMDEVSITFKSPKISFCYDDELKEVGDTYNSYLGKIPKKKIVKIDNKVVEVYNTKDILISATLLNEKYNIWISDFQYPMMYSLLDDDKQRGKSYYLRFYELAKAQGAPKITTYGRTNVSSGMYNARHRIRDSIPENFHPKGNICNKPHSVFDYSIYELDGLKKSPRAAKKRQERILRN